MLSSGREKREDKLSKNYPGGDSAVEPPDTIPNSEVKRCNADGSVGHPHVRVGHRQVTKYISKLNKNRRTPCRKIWGFCLWILTNNYYKK